MNHTAVSPRLSRMYLNAETAGEMMTPNPVSIRHDASVREAVAILVEKGFSAAPVIDDAGRPVGVLSRGDVLVHDCERVEYVATEHESYSRTDLRLRSGEKFPEDFHVESVDPTMVEDIMTPVIFSVTPDTPVEKVVQDLLSLKVHRLFVVDPDGILTGVISTVDVLRRLQAEELY